MIQIKYKDGNAERVRLEVEVSEKAIYRKELMTEEYVLLTFDTVELVNLQKGDYIDTEFGQFIIVTLDKPKHNVDSNAGWSYEQKFAAPWMRWATRKLFYARQRGAEKAWSMTQKPEYFMQIVIDNLLGAGYGEFTAQIDPTLTEMKLVQFDGDDIVSGLNKIAEAWETEWWATDNIIHLSKCEFGSPVCFEEGGLIRSMTPSDGQENDYITRLYAFGSTRNIPTNYRKSEDEEAVIESIVERRLKLPEGTDHIDAWPDMRDEDVVEGIAIFDEVYPRRIGKTHSITTVEYCDEVKDDELPDGEVVEWNAYRFKDSGIKFKSEYILPDEELRIVFQSGALMGMDFAVVFNPDGADESKPEAQVWEIVRNDTYGIDLPSDKFHPQEGDEYILYGYDTKMVSDLLIPRAEQELLEEAQKLLAKKCIDSSVYSCETDKIRCAGYIEHEGECTYNAIDVIDLDVGQSVELRSECYFPETDGSRVSRIRAFEKRLDNRFNCTYEVGETTTYSKSKELDEKMESLTIQNTQILAMGNGVYLIKRYDTTAPNDHNAYSALRADATFLNKQKPDSALDIINFKKGLTIGDYVGSMAFGSGAAIDSNGNAEFETVRVRSYFEAMEYIVNRLAAVEGDQLLTEGDTIDRVVDNGDGTFGLYLHSKWDGYYTAQVKNNVLKGIVNTLTTGSGVYYTCWLRVNSVNPALNYIEVTMYPDEEVPGGKNYPPCELMRIARWGNQTDPSRQSCLYLSSTEGRIVKLSGVTKPIIDKSNYGATFGIPPEWLKAMGLPLVDGQDYLYARGLIVQDIIRMDYQGKPVVNYVDRGEWSATADYYCEALNPETGQYETSDVWYMGCKYRCMVTGTHAAPAWNSTAWAMIEGNPDFTVEFADTDYLFDPDNFEVTLTIIARLHNIDVTQDILDTDVVWTRYSEDAQGVERVTSDNAWAIKRAGAGKSLHLTATDMDFNGYMPRTIRFTATVTLRDGMGNNAAEQQAVFEY